MSRDPLRISLKDFREAAKGGSMASGESSEVLIPKGYPTDVSKAEGDDDRTLQFRISTGSVDRDKDTVNPQGATNLAQFPTEGVVLWGHDSYLPPIADPIAAWVESDAVKSRARFTPADRDHPLGMGFGNTIREMYLDGSMKSVSIGFIPSKWAFNEDRGYWAIDFLEWELLEFSAVSIPANREAMVELGRKGIDLRGVMQWSEKCLDGGAKLIVPRDEVEESWKTLHEIFGTSTTSNTITLTESGLPDFDSGCEFETRDVISFESAHPGGTPLADREESWDGNAEVAAAEISDLEIMAAWKETASPESKAEFKLPHHKAAGEHSTVWNGVVAAMAALNGARGGVDIPEDERSGVWEHLAAHYREFDEEPPELASLEEEGDDDDEEHPKGFDFAAAADALERVAEAGLDDPEQAHHLLRCLDAAGQILIDLSKDDDDDDDELTDVGTIELSDDHEIDLDDPEIFNAIKEAVDETIREKAKVLTGQL